MKTMLHQQEKCKLAIVVPELLPVPPVKGGAVEHWVHEVSSRLDQSKYEITIISRPADSQGVSGISYIGVPWTRFESMFSALKARVSWRNPLRYIAKIQNVAAYAMRVANHTKQFDVVVIHNEPNIILFIKKMPHQKLILHMHNEHLTNAAFRWLYRKALAKVDQVICVSEYIKSTALKHFPEYSEKFTVLYNSTDPEVFKPYGEHANIALKDIVKIEKENSYLLYVGRLNAEKGVHVLIEAFAKLHAQMPNTRLIIAGSSFFEGAIKTEYEQSLVTLAKSISHAIIFTGFIPHEKLKYLYSAVDLVVVPSVWQDPCPLVVLEAMASGTCLVATKVGGVPEAVDNRVTGFLVEPSNSMALTSSILDVINNPDLKDRVEIAAREKIIKHYSWSRLVNQLDELLAI